MYDNLTEFVGSWKNNTTYFEMLRLMSSISRLFSESSIPYLDYRLTENLFCKYYNAQNDARSCTAYDARLSKLGIGIKTFGIKSGSSSEKIAEFNKLKPSLNKLRGIDLARQISIYRNERMDFADNTYDVCESIYHIIGRYTGGLKIFNTPYEKIKIDNIADVDDREAAISFNDGINEYSFNKSKSVLQKKFNLPKDYVEIQVDIIDEPLELLSKLLSKNNVLYLHDKESLFNSNWIEKKGRDYVILPLYSKRGADHVPERSGLNQWNANGRKRDANEVYIPIPKSIHKNYPTFFPSRDVPFELILPDGNKLSAKVCQDGGKALMSNPNSQLGEWILRKILRKKEGELVTIEDLYKYGIDSVKIISTHKHNENGESIYKILFSNTSSYENYSDFIDE